jgi:hypothetical protein
MRSPKLRHQSMAARYGQAKRLATVSITFGWPIRAGRAVKHNQAGWKERGHVSRNGVRYSRFYKSLRRAPAALALPVLKAVRAAQS